MSQTPPPAGGQPPYGGPPYGGPPYGGPPAGGGFPYGAPGYAPPDHQQAVLVLILGIVGLVVCGLVAPFAWVMGNRVVAEIDASNGQLGGRSAANAGRICGIVGTALIALGLLVAVAAVFFVLVAGASSV